MKKIELIKLGLFSPWGKCVFLSCFLFDTKQNFIWLYEYSFYLNMVLYRL